MLVSGKFFFYGSELGKPGGFKGCFDLAAKTFLVKGGQLLS